MVIFVCTSCSCWPVAGTLQGGEEKGFHVNMLKAFHVWQKDTGCKMTEMEDEELEKERALR